MSVQIRKMGVLSLVFAMVVFLGVVKADAQETCAELIAKGVRLVPKVDNFIIFPDQSGSMYMTHKGLGGIKMALAKQLLLDMNQIIPELGYKGSAIMFAPFAPLLAPEVYSTDQMGAALQGIPEL